MGKLGNMKGYCYEDPAVENGQAQAASSELVSFPVNNEIMLWHYKLGHPNFLYSKTLFPTLFSNKNI